MLPKSLYLDKFKKLKEQDKWGYTLFGNRILVEILPEMEAKTKSGLIIRAGERAQINAVTSDMPLFCVVLDIGEGYIGSDGEVSQDEMTVQIGDIVMLPRIGLQAFSYLPVENYVPDSIGIAIESDVRMRFEGYPAFEKFFNNL